MKLPFTQKTLINWGGEQVFHDAESVVNRGLVLNAAFEAPFIRGAVLWNNHELRTSLKLLPDGTVESQCPCFANRERGVICAHVIALGIVLLRRATDPLRDAKYQEEQRRASRLANVAESDYLRRVPADSPGAVPVTLRITLGAGWAAGVAQDRIPLLCEAGYQGGFAPLDEVPRDLPLAFPKDDEAVLFVLEDISEGPARGQLTVTRSDFLNLLRLHIGRALGAPDGGEIRVNDTPMATHLRMDLDRENGELILIAHTELPFLKPAEFPQHILSGRQGWAYGAGNFWPLRNLLPGPYHALYDAPVIVARTNVISFLRKELPVLCAAAALESDLSLDLFTVEPAVPRFRLAVRGSQASLSASLYAQYNGIELCAGRPDARELFAIPDPSDLMRYTVRDLEAERRGLGVLAACGMSGPNGEALGDIVGRHEVLNFLGGHMPALRRRGWRIDFEGKITDFVEGAEFATPVVHIAEGGNGWFDVGFEFEDGQGGGLTQSEVMSAILRGESFIERNGRTVLIDSDAVESLRGVFADCETGDAERSGHFRLPDIYAPFVKSSLDAIDGVDMEDTPEWRQRAGRCNRDLRLEPVPLPDPLEQILRPYQKEGVYWLRFLEQSGFCGVLADEMGLGKTLQTLAWLQLARARPEAGSKPALIVCPTSIVENWAEEAQRYAPRLRVLTLAGPDRHARFEKIAESDLVVTSYALLRRDLEQHLSREFAVVVLDEAQHIKNRSTQNALAAKKLRARQRLVLTGTPVENSVADLWSIMDFLMPGYLGSHDNFRANYELPITRAGAEAEQAQHRLRRKLHPFLLRRLKTEVARDLPAKIQKVSLCALTPDQQTVYRALLQASQRKIADMVSSQGFNKARMEILTTLMRLRQACCHLELLKLPGLKAENPSAKLELFFELLDEALDGGHRILVFSQFVSMLHILEQELQKRELTYCYLDGATKERLSIVHKFNTERSIPLFLISLKAGGTGLNLTGADMVIHFDPWWNPAVEDQATDRAYRIGQKRTVYSIKLITRGTVEEKVLALQARKKAVISATIENDEEMIRALNWEDVQELLEL